MIAYKLYDFQDRKHCENALMYRDVNKRVRWQCGHETKVVCFKCLSVVAVTYLIHATRIKGLSKENAAKFKQCPHCKCRTFI